MVSNEAGSRSSSRLRGRLVEPLQGLRLGAKTADIQGVLSGEQLEVVVRHLQVQALGQPGDSVRRGARHLTQTLDQTLLLEPKYGLRGSNPKEKQPVGRRVAGSRSKKFLCLLDGLCADQLGPHDVFVNGDHGTAPS